MQGGRGPTRRPPGAASVAAGTPGGHTIAVAASDSAVSLSGPAGTATVMTDDKATLDTCLAGLDYPISREDLVRCAQERGVDTATLQALRSLPVEQVASPDDVQEALSDLP
jgi:hypothetical protein